MGICVEHQKFFTSITPDGKYFFFISGRKTDVDKGKISLKSGKKPEEDSDLYWADFSFIKNLKNTVLSKRNAAEITKRDYREKGIQSAVDTLKNLYVDHKNSTYFPPFELLSLTKDMMAEGKTQDALAVLQFTVKKFPNDPWAYYSLARVYHQLGDLDKAIENCKKSLEISPDVGDISQLMERLIEERKQKKKYSEQLK
ncbi:MAG: tetratricopeptide repeat protein [Candidatus Aminicenantes bacterium]|nr:tetratricopeptide repeat protein [Candidatus Aminicenantes bacterium]